MSFPAARTSARLRLKIFFLLAGLLVPAAPAGAAYAAQDRTEVEVRRRTGEIEVDGRLDEAAWADAEPIPLAWEVAPGDNEPAPVSTECRLAYDDDALYLGCLARDPAPGEIRAYYATRDATAGHDRIFLVLDPFRDARRGFEFGVSALGVQEDRVWDESTAAFDPSWDAVWRSAGRITGEGYEVEAAIPFRSLRFPSTAGERAWGFYLKREWPRTEVVETRSTPWERDRGCVLCQAGRLRGLRGGAPGVDLQLAPTLTTARVDRRAEAGAGLVPGPIELAPGLDVRWNATTDLTLNATLNPDFSQVEADAPQLDANRRFALRFPEKRPFFLEGADLFTTPVEAVFTRTVADPSAGAKVTGKLGGSAFGAMLVRDEVTGILLPGSQGSSTAVLETPSTTAVLRYRHDVGDSGTLGALYTARLGQGYGNHVLGGDAYLRPLPGLPALSLRAQLLRSVTTDPPALRGGGEEAGGDGTPSGGANHGPAPDPSPDSPTGDAGLLRLRYADRDWAFGATVVAFGPAFRADAGFVPQVGFRNVDGWAARTFWGGDGAPFTSLRVEGGAWSASAWSGGLLNEGVWGNVVYGGPWQTEVWLNPVLSRERLEGRVFGLTQLWAGLSLRPSGALRLGVSGNGGDAIDAADLRRVRELRASPSIEVRVGRHLELGGAAHWQRLSLGGETILRALATDLRGVYGFGTRSSLRATLQLRDTDRSPALHPEPVAPSRTSLRTDLLFAYRLDPLSVVFIGVGDVRSASVEPNLRERPLGPEERSFFLKLGYGWRP